ncbi:MAG: hypothetical protein ACR5LD_11720 [Symbiopectobacterium sp.]
MLDLLVNRVPPGVDEAAYVKAGFLAVVAKGEAHSTLVSPEKSVELLSTMQGGYNIHPLIEALGNEAVAPIVVDALSHTLLMFDNFYDVEKKAKVGNVHAKRVVQSWLMLNGFSLILNWRRKLPSPFSKSSVKPILMTSLQSPMSGLALISRCMR